MLRRFERIARNAAWLFAARGAQLAAGFLVGAWIARYLGPEEFGTLRYAMAFASLFGIFAALGLNTVLVRDLVKRPGEVGLLLGTALTLRAAAGLGAAALVAGSIALVKPGQPVLVAMSIIIGLTFVVKASEVVKAWFEYQVVSGVVVRIEMLCLVLSAGVKLALVIHKAPLIAFAWALLIEALLYAAAMAVLWYRYVRPVVRLSAGFACARNLLGDSWPLMVSALSVMVYMRIDILMLGEMRDSASVGIYSVAVQLTEIWHMVPMVIAASVFPSMVGLRASDPARYQVRLVQLLRLLIVAAVAIGFGALLVSSWLVGTLYGADYVQSAAVAKIHVWSLVFVYIGIVGNRWYVAEGLQRMTLYRTLAGAVTNVVLNLVIIPEYGPEGAAVATVISCAVSAYLWDAVHARSRPLFRTNTRALSMRGTMVRST